MQIKRGEKSNQPDKDTYTDLEISHFWKWMFFSFTFRWMFVESIRTKIRVLFAWHKPFEFIESGEWNFPFSFTKVRHQCYRIDSKKCVAWIYRPCFHLSGYLSTRELFENLAMLNWFSDILANKFMETPNLRAFFFVPNFVIQMHKVHNSIA